MSSLLKITITIIVFVLATHASFDQEISKIAGEISEELKLSPDRPLYITYVPDDKSYILPMEPVFNELKKKLKPYVSEIRFKSSDMETLYDILRRGISVPFEEVTIDSLILTGSYFLMNKDLDRVNCVLKIQDIHAVNIYQSDEFTIFANDCPPELSRKLFNTLVNKESYGEIEYKGFIIEKLEKLFNTLDNDLLVPPAYFAFEDKNPHAIPYQLNIFKEILNLKYGISYYPESKNKIVIKQDGSVSFIKNGAERQLPKMIDGEEPFKNFPSHCDSYDYTATTSTINGPVKKIETRKISKEEEFKVRDKILETFTTYYPKLFNPFNYEKLDKIFADTKDPSILTGTVIPPDPLTGREVVNYQWLTKAEWLSELKRFCDSLQRTFELKTNVVKLYNDDLDPNRYWAIVRQNWKTFDAFGKMIYQDNGFLFVNFDFTTDRVLKDFKIYYRLWFNEYQYDDLEKGIKRHEKLKNDIVKHFENGNIKGISSMIKKAMCDYLVSQIQGPRPFVLSTVGDKDTIASKNVGTDSLLRKK